MLSCVLPILPSNASGSAWVLQDMGMNVLLLPLVPAAQVWLLLSQGGWAGPGLLWHEALLALLSVGTAALRWQQLGHTCSWGTPAHLLLGHIWTPAAGAHLQLPRAQLQELPAQLCWLWKCPVVAALNAVVASRRILLCRHGGFERSIRTDSSFCTHSFFLVGNIIGLYRGTWELWGSVLPTELGFHFLKETFGSDIRNGGGSGALSLFQLTKGDPTLHCLLGSLLCLSPCMYL